MIKVVKIALVIIMVFALTGCVAEAEEPIVGQWAYESGNYWYLIRANGDAYRISLNAQGDYITSAEVYETWYKEDGKYYWKAGFEEPVHIDGDTLVFGTDVYEWRRVPEDELIPLSEIYYFTFDKEDLAYEQHTLDELLGG